MEHSTDGKAYLVGHVSSSAKTVALPGSAILEISPEIKRLILLEADTQ